MKFKTIQIVKIGSQALFREHDRIDINKINDIGHDVKRLRDERGIMTILVTSGAISLGRMRTSIRGIESRIVEARVAASVGQIELMQLYKLSIGEEVAQILATHDGLNGGDKEKHFKEMMRVLVSNGVFPIVNYNDTADDYELQHVSNFSDNDKLTEKLAIMLKVDRVVILSNVDGFMDGAGNLIERVTAADDFGAYLNCCSLKSNKGTGGMCSKVQVGKTLLEHGIEMVIGNSKYPLIDVIEGNVPRTVFVP